MPTYTYLLLVALFNSGYTISGNLTNPTSATRKSFSLNPTNHPISPNVDAKRQQAKIISRLKDPVEREDIIYNLLLSNEEANSKIGAQAKEILLLTESAEFGEFLLYLRNELRNFEDMWSAGVLPQHEFVKNVSEKTKIPRLKLSIGNIHFRKWMWILLYGDEVKCESIEKLRVALNKDYKRYLWFSSQMSSVFKVLPKDTHGKSALNTLFMKRENFQKYTKLFNAEMRSAMQTFLQNVYY